MVHNTRTRRLAALVQKVLGQEPSPQDWFQCRTLVRKYLTTTKTTTNWITALIYRKIKNPPRGEQEIISKALLKLQKISKAKGTPG